MPSMMLGALALVLPGLGIELVQRTANELRSAPDRYRLMHSECGALVFEIVTPPPPPP